MKNQVCPPALRSRGFTLVELMVALTAGLILIAALMVIYGAASRTDRSVKRTGELIENARYGMFNFADDIRHAGYYGTYVRLGTFPTVLPDPCLTSAADVKAALPMALQVYNGGTNPPISCIASNDYLPGSDVVVIRRARTSRLEASADLVPGALYIQSNGSAIDVQLGAANFDIAQHNANVTATTLFRKKLLPTDPAPAELRRAEVHIYFVSRCSNDSCGSSGGDGIPTLKRLELGAGPAFTVIPVAAGVERMHVDLGLDQLPATLNPQTGTIGDGVPDSYKKAADMTTVANWDHVVAARIYIVVRELEQTVGYVDAKTYDVGESEPAGYKPLGNFRRHAFQSVVFIVNRGGKRET
jgi:type IV pilus assembly protein PilW